jgi:hypothetical protein
MPNQPLNKENAALKIIKEKRLNKQQNTQKTSKTY